MKNFNNLLIKTRVMLSPLQRFALGGFQHLTNTIFTIIIAILLLLSPFKAAYSSGGANAVSPVNTDKEGAGKTSGERYLAWPLHLLKQSESLCKDGNLGFAESCSDEAWNEIIRNSPIKTNAQQDRLVQFLWSNVALPYLQQQRIELWSGESSSNQYVSGAIDAKYASDKASRIISAILHDDYKARLLLGENKQAPSKSNVDFNSSSAQRARDFLDFIGQSVGMNVNGLIQQPTPVGWNAKLQQPAGAEVYVEAARPLFGAEGSAISGQSQVCLLSSLQIETTLVAIKRQNFIEREDVDYAVGNRLLQYLKTQYPQYPRAD